MPTIRVACVRWLVAGPGRRSGTPSVTRTHPDRDSQHRVPDTGFRPEQAVRCLRERRPAGSVLALALVLAFLGCREDSELRTAVHALDAAAPVEFGAWKAAVEAREAAGVPVSESDALRMERSTRRTENLLSALGRELDAEVEAAWEVRDERLRIAQAAREHYVETWNERRGDLRFARPGFGIGVGNAAVAAVQSAERDATRTRQEFEAAEAEAEQLTAEAQAEFDRVTEESRASLMAAFSPEQRVLYVAIEAEDAARQRLVETAPEAWAAYEARAAQVAEQESERGQRILLLMRLALIPGLALVPAWIARQNGRSFWRWWLYGLLPMLLVMELRNFVTLWLEATTRGRILTDMERGMSYQMSLMRQDLGTMVLALIPAWIARKKGRLFWLWWLYGWFPLLLPVALIHALVMSADE